VVLIKVLCAKYGEGILNSYLSDESSFYFFNVVEGYAWVWCVRWVGWVGCWGGGIGISISTVNEDQKGDCSVWRFEVGEFFSVGMRMKVKVPPKEVWGWRRYFILRPVETPFPKTSKITFINYF
jgi:hypothetical protein